MDTKDDFYKTIYKYYCEITSDKISYELLQDLSARISDYYYEQYGRFTLKYPKSEKRYSTFQVKDLDHPKTYEIVINFFKEKLGSDYSYYTETALRMNSSELKTFEKNRCDFYKLF